MAESSSFNHKEDGVGDAAATYLKVHALFFPIANGDDALAFAIPLEVVANFIKKEHNELRARHGMTNEIAHFPRDNLVLSLEHLIFAYGVPNANWP